MYYSFYVGDNEYKLRINIKNVVALEKQLGCNPINIFGDGETIPTITVMVQILHASLQALQSNISMERAFSIFEAWLNEGHTIVDFLPVIIEIYKVSGIIAVDEGEEKNA